MAESEKSLQGLNLFLSYSASDEKLALNVKDVLYRHGARIWMDTDNIAVGSRFSDQLRDAIDSCHAIIAIVSQDYLTSAWAMLEMGAGWASNVPLFQILSGISRAKAPFADLSTCDISEIETRLLSSLKSLAHKNFPDENADAQKLKKSIGYEIERVCKNHADICDSSWQMLQDLFSQEITARIAAQEKLKDGSAGSDKILSLLLEFVDSYEDHVRAEACFCLGSFKNSSGDYLVSERFLGRGLRDGNQWVAACCAAALRERVPLDDRTLEILAERLRDAKREFRQNPSAPALAFRAHETLEAHRTYQRQ